MDDPHADPRLIIIADDLTGAADTSAPFARVGWHCVLRLEPDFSSSADVVALSTDSRGMNGADARAAVGRALHGLNRGAAVIYKKIDSTLRGHPGVELAAALEALRVDKALVAPAFPAQGRATIDGRQCIGGKPLEEIDFGPETLCSELRVVFSSISHACHHLPLSIVRSGLDVVIGQFESPAHGVWLADAETDADLVTLARAGTEAGIRLFCGSAGLAAALARSWCGERVHPAFTAINRAAGPALVVAGSRNAVTLEQIEVLKRRGCTEFALEDVEAGIFSAVPSDCVVLHARRVKHATAENIAQRLGHAARALMARRAFSKLVVTGGDTAVATLRALGVKGLEIRGEIAPGIPRSVAVGGGYSGIEVITKAGGFGDANALALAALG